MTICDIHGHPIPEDTPWFKVRQEFQEYLKAEQADHRMQFVSSAEQSYSISHSYSPAGSMSEAAFRRHGMTIDDVLARDGKIKADYTEGVTIKVIAFEQRLSLSQVKRIINK
jgi:hypothetical protein